MKTTIKKHYVVLGIAMVLVSMLLVACQKTTELTPEEQIESQIIQRSQKMESVLPYSDEIPIVAIISKYEGDPFLDQVVQSAKESLEAENIRVIVKSPVSPYESTFSQNRILMVIPRL